MLLQKSQRNLRLVYDYLVKWREVGVFSWKKAGNIHVVFIQSAPRYAEGFTHITSYIISQ